MRDTGYSNCNEALMTSMISNFFSYFKISIFYSQVDQLSLIVRWIKVSTKDKVKIEVKETFFGFISMSSGKAQDIANLAILTLENFGITLEKLRGQVSLILNTGTAPVFH